jgi:hypothetical protein
LSVLAVSRELPEQKDGLVLGSEWTANARAVFGRQVVRNRNMPSIISAVSRPSTSI